MVSFVRNTFKHSISVVYWDMVERFLYKSKKPCQRIWGKKIPGMRIASNLKCWDKKVDIRYIYENYLKTMENKFGEKERIPGISEEWIHDISDLRKSKRVTYAK